MFQDILWCLRTCHWLGIMWCAQTSGLCYRTPNIRIVPHDSRSGLYYIESGPSGSCYRCPEVCCPNEAASGNRESMFPDASGNHDSRYPDASGNIVFWLSGGSPISPDVRPRRSSGAKILSQFWASLSKQNLFRMSTGCQKDRNTGRQTYRQTDRQTERQIEDRKTFQLSYQNKSC